MSKFIKLLGIAVCLFVGIPQSGLAAEQPQTWDLVNPAGIVIREWVDAAPRISSLEGKTVALFWNGKHNGDVILNHLAELLTQRVPNIKIVKIYEQTALRTAYITGRDDLSKEKAEFVKSFKPDLVIGSQAD